MVYRGQIQWFVYQGIPEIRPRQLEANFEPGAAQAVVVGIVHVEHEVEGTAAEPQAGDIDLLQLDLRVLERERVS